LELDPLKTLQELRTKSDFIGEMKLANMPADIHYHLIGGDTSLLAANYDGDDPFLKKMATGLANKLLYPGLTKAVFENKPNDMAVTLESMQSINGIDLTQFYTAATNHIGYFGDKKCRKQLMEILEKKIHHQPVHP